MQIPIKKEKEDFTFLSCKVFLIRKGKKMKNNPNLKAILSYIITFAIAAAVVFALNAVVVTKQTVSGPSMEPTLQNKQNLLTFKLATPHRGDIIVFNAEGVDPDAGTKKTYYIKRVIGLPGDTVRSKDGKLYVNGHLVNQSYISKYQADVGTGNWDLKKLSTKNNWVHKATSNTVPQNEYFCLGDHRSVSNDSRYFGFVPTNKVIGVSKSPMLPLFGGNNKQYVNKFHHQFFMDEKLNQKN